MANGNEFNATVATLFRGMDAFLTTKSVVGEPINIGDTTIIPLCDVNFSVGAGAFGGKRSDATSGGMGGKLSPSAIIVIKDGYSQIINVNAEKGSLAKVIEMIPEAADKLKQVINRKQVTDDEMEQIEEYAEGLDDTEV